MSEGFVSVKHGEIKTFCVTQTKRDMLIGYDLLSLSGLHVCEQRLKEKGIIISPCRVEIVKDWNPTCYSMTYQGALDGEAMSYTVNSDNPIRAQVAMAGYLSNYIPMACNERDTLKRFWLGYQQLLKDGRRRTTADKLRYKAMKIMESFGANLVHIKITPKSA